jgi:polyferredoxin
MIPTTITGRLKHDMTHRGVTAWLLSGALMTFYGALYWTSTFDTLAVRLGLPNKWFLYGAIYSVAMLGGGAWVVQKYRHNRYQIIRTVSVVFFQLSFGFSIPLFLTFLRQPAYYFHYIWPLKIDYFYPETIAYHPWPFVFWSFVAALVIAPVLGLFYGKRWYCSWVCGCGGLANTFGDPWRHLSDKSSSAWKLERSTIYTVWVISLITTGLAFLSALLPSHHEFALIAARFREIYGLVVASVLAGVLGTGLYPIGGTRVWCRYFCPMAAMLGVVQKFGTFRIKVKNDMCISCGLCSTYCEMGIDVRWYAQANQSFTRASCVGCGICAEVCPRGVLRLESKRAGLRIVSS